MSYREKLKDPRWQKKRLEIFERDEWECIICGDRTKQLHAHHIYYKNGFDPWEYESDEIITLCETCHTAVHEDYRNQLYGLVRRILTDRWFLECAEQQKLYDIGGFMRLIGQDDITIDHDLFCLCDVERNYIPNKGINFKLKEI